jgi:hypothetical protein
MDKDKIEAIKRLVYDCRSGSKRKKKVLKGIDQCDVTFDSMLSLMESQRWECAEGGQPFHLSFRMGKRILEGDRKALGINSTLLPSIDRIDNNKGYMMDNIRIVTNGYNQMRNIYEDSDVREWINSIKKK